MAETDFAKIVLHSHICPYFHEPPVNDADIEWIERFWTFCDYEDRCLDKGRCPILQTELPRLKGAT